MYILVVKGAEESIVNRESQFRVAKIVINACRFCVLVDTFARGSVQLFTVRLEAEINPFFQSCFTYLDTALMGGIADGKT